MCRRRPSRARVEPARRGRLRDRHWARAPCRLRRSPGTRRRGRNRRCRAAPSAAAARAARAGSISAPGAIPGGNLSSSIETRTRGGSSPPVGATRQPDRSAWPPDDRPIRPAPMNCVTTGRSSRGCATHAGPRPDQRAAERRGEREPAERPPGPAAAEREADQAPAPAATHRNACHCARRAKREPGGDAGCRNRRRTRAAAARAPPRGASPAPRAAAENRVFQ